MSYAADKQRNKQTNKQTDSKILRTPPGIVNVGTNRRSTVHVAAAAVVVLQSLHVGIGTRLPVRGSRMRNDVSSASRDETKNYAVSNCMDLSSSCELSTNYDAVVVVVAHLVYAPTDSVTLCVMSEFFRCLLLVDVCV